jgi:hypothetical protein
MARSLHIAAAMSPRRFAALLFSTSLVACATDSADESVSGGGGKADGETAQISFGDDWSETVRGDLVAGAPVRIVYDLDRLQECRGETNGSEVWGVTGYASFDGKEPVTFAVSRLDGGVVKPVSAELDIPATAHSVELWFASSNRWGCISYDSNENANYEFSVEAATTGAVLAFNADHTESQSGAVVGGTQVVVHYEPERLATCAASSGGYAKWSVTMHYKVDGGSEKSLLVTRAEGSDLVPSDPTISVPRGSDLEVWFDATSVYGCHEYDSNGGANYHYAIE